MTTRKLAELDAYFRSLMDFEGFARIDPGLNGIQIGDIAQDVKRVAFAVDASLETFERAAEWDADVLFVHHGLWWGSVFPLTGIHYRRCKVLFDKGIALYAVHLPLDQHPEFGNNIGLARKLGLEEVEPFGSYKGRTIGTRGKLPRPLTTEEIVQKMFVHEDAILGKLPFGKDLNSSVAIVSGGGGDTLDQAIAANIDCFITGDAEHKNYHHCLEARINVIFAGHYLSEIWGVSLLAQKLREDLGLETRFLDVPTGL